MAEGWTYVLCHQDFRFELKAGEQTVGRSRTSDVAVNDPSVSRKHVIVRPKDGLVLLTDLGSSNGTFINGKKVQGEAVLENGDVLRLGDAELRVEIAGGASLEAAASEADSADSMQTVRLPAGGPRPQPGEATFFLAAESMKLAEALEAAQGSQAPEPGSHLSGPLATQRLPASALPGAAGHETQRLSYSPVAPTPAAAPASPLGTQRIDLVQNPLPPPPAAPAPAGAQTVRLSAAEMRQLESPPASAFDAAPVSFEPAGFGAPSFDAVSFDPGPAPAGAAPAYPSFEAPPAFEPWAPPPAAAESSFAGIADPSSPSIERPPAPYLPTETKFVEPEPPTPSFPPLAPPPASFAPPAPPPVPAFAPPVPAFDRPTPPAAPPPPSFAPPAPPPVPAFAPPAAFDRPTPPAAPPPPAAADALRGLRQPSSAGELLPSLDDLDAAIGTPGIQDPLQQQRSGTAQVPAGVPWGEPCAGFGIRLLAYLLDALWIAAVQTAAIIFSDSDPIFTSAASLVTLAVIFFGWSIWGTTPGKRVVGLYLHGEDGQTGIGFLRAFIRMVGYFVSGLFFGIGFLMIAFTKDHRGLHDRIARTWVYRHSS